MDSLESWVEVLQEMCVVIDFIGVSEDLEVVYQMVGYKID